MNPASAGLLTQQHTLNMWSVLISLSQIWFILSAEPQMMPAGHLVTCVEVQWTLFFSQLVVTPAVCGLPYAKAPFF